jgi:C-terminal peptidase prc
MGDDVDDEEEKDYWEGVDFGPEDFAEVRRFVKFFYIDPGYDKHLAWLTAASFALRTMEPSREAVPEDWWRRKQAEAKERKRWEGEPERLRKGDLFLVARLAKDGLDLPKGTLTPNQIRARKAEYRQRNSELDRAWARVPFTEADFDRVMDWIKAQPGAKPDFKPSKFFVAAAQGYLASLDPHSTIVSAKAWDESTRTTTDGSFEGIGAVLMKRGDDILVENPMEGQPAFKAGLRAGDVVVSVDGKAVGGLELQKVVKRIRGSKGSTVVLAVRRLGEPRDLTFAIVRDHIEVKNVQAHMLDRHPDVGYVKVTGFVPSTREAVQQAVDTLKSQTKGGRLRGLVLDMRGNSGGLLQESVDMADDFLDDGVIVSVKNPSDRDEVFKAEPGSWTFPTVVLVNDGSASAAEILASALQENRRALVVGDRTFGKASVQTLLNPLLRRDYYIKLTVARYYAPSGRTIQVTGVVPDITVPPAPGEQPPVGFREEDLHHHLSRLSGEYKSPNLLLTKKVLACDKRTGIGDQVAKADPHPQVKPDYPLLKAADYLECVMSFEDGAPPSDTAVSR